MSGMRFAQVVVALAAVALAAPTSADDKPAERAAAKPAKPPRREDVGVAVDGFAAPINRILAGKIVVRKPVEADPNAAITLQYAAQLRPLLIAELNNVRQNCDLSVEQRGRVRAAAEAELLVVARSMFRQQQPQIRIGGVNAAVSEPRKRIRDAIDAALAETLAEEPLKTYRAESARRSEFRRRAAINYVVARLDRTLYLTPEQRQEVTRSLTDNWQDSWESWPLMQVYGDQYFPVVPDQYIIRPLKPDQVSVWRGLQKIQISSLNSIQGNVVEDDGWWGPEPLAGPAADAVALPAAGF